MKQKIRESCDRDVLVIPNGISHENLGSLSREKARAGLHIGEVDKIIVFVGRLQLVKGVKYLIQSMDIVSQRESGVKLLIVGDGREMANLKNLVAELNLGNSVTFTGEVPNEKVPEYLIASDVFVLPSLFEGFPNVVLGAMAAGLPVVATRVGGMPEIVTDAENGFLVDAEAPNQIAEKVQLLLQDDDLVRSISSNNKEKANDYTWERVVQMLEGLYYTLVR